MTGLCHLPCTPMLARKLSMCLDKNEEVLEQGVVVYGSPLLPQHSGAKAELQDTSGPHSEFQDSQSHTQKPGLENNNEDEDILGGFQLFTGNKSAGSTAHFHNASHLPRESAEHVPVVPTLVTGGAQEQGSPQHTLKFVFSDFGLEGRRSGAGAGGEGAAGSETIHRFPEIIPPAALEVKGCHVTCCQVAKRAGGKCGRERASLSMVGFKLCPGAGADIWRAAAVDLRAVRF